MIGQYVNAYCSENIEEIENYKEAINDKEKMWDVHHRLETHDENGNKRLYPVRKTELVNNNLYYRRPAKELIFLKKEDHHKLHEELDFNVYSHLLNNKENNKWYKEAAIIIGKQKKEIERLREMIAEDLEKYKQYQIKKENQITKLKNELDSYKEENQNVNEEKQNYTETKIISKYEDLLEKGLNKEEVLDLYYSGFLDYS